MMAGRTAPMRKEKGREMAKGREGRGRGEGLEDGESEVGKREER